VVVYTVTVGNFSFACRREHLIPMALMIDLHAPIRACQWS